MKAKKGFNIHKICGENIVVAEGKENMDFSNIISMNESSALLWNSIQGKDFTIDDLAQLLIDNYQIDDNTPLPLDKAKADATAVVDQWRDAGILED